MVRRSPDTLSVRNIADRSILNRHPYLQLATLELPKTIKESFPLIEAFTLTFPLISEALRKLATYPITNIVYDTEDEIVKKRWKEIIEDVLCLPEKLCDVNYNYLLYGNTFLSVTIPREKVAKCPLCKKRFSLTSDIVSLTSGKIDISACPKCGRRLPEVEIREKTKKDPYQLNLLLWNPKNIIIEYNPYTGQSEYWYQVPPTEKDIYIGKKATKLFKQQILETPLKFLEAILQGKLAHIRGEKILHMRSPILSGWDQAWGCPRLLFVLKHMYYLLLMLRAQEAILRDHLVPLRVLHLPTVVQGMQGIVDVTLQDARKKLISEIEKWKQDPNHIAIVPLPVTYSNFSGQGKMLNVVAEISEWSKQIIASLGIPPEFIYGQLTWSGSNVSLRMLENDLLTLRNYDVKILNFVVDQVRSYFPEFPPIKLRLSEFKMADDATRREMLLQLASKEMISYSTLLQDFNIDFKKEIEKKIQENVMLSDLDISAMLRQIKAQSEAQLQKFIEERKLQKVFSPAMTGQQPPTGSPQSAQESQEEQIPAQETAPKEEKEERKTLKKVEKEQLPEQKPPRRGPESSQV